MIKIIWKRPLNRRWFVVLEFVGHQKKNKKNTIDHSPHLRVVSRLTLTVATWRGDVAGAMVAVGWSKQYVQLRPKVGCNKSRFIMSMIYVNMPFHFFAQQKNPTQPLELVVWMLEAISKVQVYFENNIHIITTTSSGSFWQHYMWYVFIGQFFKGIRILWFYKC